MKKIQVEIDKIYTRNGTEVRGIEQSRKREKIRRQKMFHAAASMIQRRFRIYRAKLEAILKRVNNNNY